MASHRRGWHSNIPRLAPQVLPALGSLVVEVDCAAPPEWLPRASTTLPSPVIEEGVQIPQPDSPFLSAPEGASHRSGIHSFLGMTHQRLPSTVEKGTQFSWSGFPGPDQPHDGQLWKRGSDFPSLASQGLSGTEEANNGRGDAPFTTVSPASIWPCRGWCNFPHLFPHGLSGPTEASHGEDVESTD